MTTCLNLGEIPPLEQCLSEASQAGYSGIEAGGKFPKTSKELLPKLEKFNLQLCSGWHGAHLLKNSVKEEMIRNSPAIGFIERL